MQCFSPITLRTDEGFKTVPCGKCAACLSNKRSWWIFRLRMELRYSISAYFVTLTYDEDHLPEKGVNVQDIQLFLKRLRHNSKEKIRYFLVSEYGTNTKRPHYHAIIFNLDADKVFASEKILSAWQNGNVMLGTVTPESIAYVCKYVINPKLDVPEGKNSTFALMSRRPGIGYKYLEDATKWHIDGQRFYTMSEDGIRGSLPRYYAEKIFDVETRKRHAEFYRLQIRAPDEIYNCPEPFREDMIRKENFSKKVFNSKKCKKF